MPGFQRIGGKGPKLVRYAEYLRYIDAGEPRGTLSHEDWLAKQAVTRAEHEARHGRGTARTHCANGHELTPENVYQRPQGWRECKICRAAPSYRGR